MKAGLYSSIFFLLFLAGFVSSVSAQTFPCDNGQRLYFFQDTLGANGALSYITNYTAATPSVTVMFPMPTQQHNGLGANPIDNYLYYLNFNQLARLTSAGVATNICPMAYVSLYGCFDHKGRYWTMQNGNLEAFDISTCAKVKGPFPLTLATGFLDMVFNPKDCRFYIGDQRVDTNGVVDALYPNTVFLPSGTYGGAAIGSDGNIYGTAGSGSAGNLSVINLTTNMSQNISAISPGPIAVKSDMASFLCTNINAFFTDSFAVCNSLTVFFSDSSTGPVGNWNWNFGDPASGPNNTSTLQDPSHAYSAAGTYTVTLIVSTGSNLCYATASDTAMMIVTVSPSSGLLVTPAQNNISCYGLCNGSASVTVSSGTAPFTYSWNSGQTTSSATALCAGIYTVNVSDAGGCSSTLTVAITQPSALTATLTGTPAQCSAANGTVSVAASGGTVPYSYLWNNGQTTQSATGLGAGNYTVTLTDANGCTLSDTLSILSTGSITATAGNSTICSGQTATLAASGGSSYSWSNGNTTSAIFISPTISATYTVIVSSGSCSDTAFASVTVNSSPVVTLTGLTALCTGDSTILTASGGGNYSWNTGATSSSISVTPSASASYSVVVSNANGCSSSATISVTVSSPPVAGLNNATICSGQTVSLTATGGGAYSWSTGATASSITDMPTSTSSYSVIVSIGSCSDTASSTVVVNQVPVASAWNNVTISAGSSTTLAASGGGSYAWSNGSVGSAISVSPTVTTLYCVTVSVNNCTDTACVTVYIEPVDCSPAVTGELFLPNAFSPNGDDENDRLKLFFGNMQCIKSYDLQIYNRWGEIVFETTSPLEEWEGTYGGKTEESAVFVYCLKATLLDGTEIIKKGSISLLK